MLKSFFAVALLSTISTAFLPGSVNAAKVEANSCKDLNKVSMTLAKSVDGAKLNTTLIARARPRYIVRFYYSDSSFTNYVGRGTFRCDGSSTLTGQSTPYYKVVSDEPCCGLELC